MKFEDLTSEQKEKVQACKTREELRALAKTEGFELSDKDLEEISGGWGGCEDFSLRYEGRGKC